MPTAILGERRQPFYRDRDGLLSMSLAAGETESIVLDWADRLGTDTIATTTVGQVTTVTGSSWQADGPTIASSSATTTSATAVVSGCGTLTNTVMTTGGKTHVEQVRVYESPRSGAQDYA